MKFSYVDVVSPSYKGTLNLFWGNFPIALVDNVFIADQIRASTPRKTEQANTADEDGEQLCLCPLHFGDCVEYEGGKCNSPLI